MESPVKTSLDEENDEVCNERTSADDTAYREAKELNLLKMLTPPASPSNSPTLLTSKASQRERAIESRTSDTPAARAPTVTENHGAGTATQPIPVEESITKRRRRFLMPLKRSPTAVPARQVAQLVAAANASTVSEAPIVALASKPSVPVTIHTGSDSHHERARPMLPLASVAERSVAASRGRPVQEARSVVVASLAGGSPSPWSNAMRPADRSAWSQLAAEGFEEYSQRHRPSTHGSLHGPASPVFEFMGAARPTNASAWPQVE